MNVCCATLLWSQLVGPACVQARSSNPRGRACRPSGKGLGILSGVVPVYLYCPAVNVTVSLGSVDHVKMLVLLHAIQGHGKTWKTPRKVLVSPGKPCEMFCTNLVCLKG